MRNALLAAAAIAALASASATAQTTASASSETAVRLRPRGAGAGLKSGGACLGVVDMRCLRGFYPRVYQAHVPASQQAGKSALSRALVFEPGGSVRSVQRARLFVRSGEALVCKLDPVQDGWLIARILNR